FSTNELVTYEGLGLCEPGKGGELIDSGAVTYGGKWVVNPSGGLISKGHPLGATGLAQCAELNWQLRGRAEQRQVKDAQAALAHGQRQPGPRLGVGRGAPGARDGPEAPVALPRRDDGRSRDAMLFGVQMFPTHYAIRPDVLAREAEARGFESVWFPEHTHIPTSRRSPRPGGPVLPKEYSHTHDLFVSLTIAAAVTTRIKVASGICLLVERDPIVTAKEVASLDFLSGGRVLFGIGAGWNAEEMEHHGTAFRTRWKLLKERVL